MESAAAGSSTSRSSTRNRSSEGWVPTSDGASVVNEPQGSPGWYSAEGITVIGNGNLLSTKTRNGKTTWHWYEDSPMAPCLTTVTNGVFELRVLRHGKHKFYPFSSGGGVADDAFVFYALEPQAKSMYDRTVGACTIVHEIAHQWFGNAVTLSVRPDLWLNEGFARFSEWIYNERHGGETAQAAFERVYARAPTHPCGRGTARTATATSRRPTSQAGSRQLVTSGSGSGLAPLPD